jgi:hypothetical protein
MEFSTLKAQLEAARSVDIEAFGAHFKVLLPTNYACRIAIEINLDVRGRVVGGKSARAILDASVTGWDGVKASHFLPDAGDDPVTFSAAALADLLDMRLDIADRLTSQIAEKLDERRQRMEAARKN